MKRVLFVILILLTFAADLCAFTGEGHVNVKKATVRSGPSRKNKILDYIVQDLRISITKKQGQWYKITYVKDDKQKKGWISASLIRLIEKSDVQVEFSNINEKFKKHFVDNLLFLDSQLKGYDLSKLKLTISFSSEAGVASMSFNLPFNKKHYDEKMTKEMSGSFIDFMVYNDYLWALVKYKKHVSESVKKESMDDFQVIMSFNTNLVLKKDNGNSVILSGKVSGDYVVFNPYVDVDIKGYNPFRVVTSDPESVEENSVFYLPQAKSSDGKLKPAALLYNYFDLDY